MWGKEKIRYRETQKKLLSDLEFRENRRSEIRTLLKGRKLIYFRAVRVYCLLWAKFGIKYLRMMPWSSCEFS
jgi:hypothetical protein